MASIRHQIVAALETRLATITVANGYQTGLGSRVFSWRKHAVTAAECPCLLIQDTDLERDYETEYGLAWNRLTIEVAAVAKSSTTTTQARAMEEDIIKCLADWEKAGGLASWVRVERSSLVMEQADQLVGAATLIVVVQYPTELNQC